MTRTIELGTALGVRLRVQPMLAWLLGGLVLWQLAKYGLSAALSTTLDLALLSAVVVYHELAHALVARRFGVRVLDITLWPLGGMARLAEMPEDSRTETWIAAAGPLANLALALLVLPVWLLTAALPVLVGPFALIPLFFGKLLVVNVVLGVFNLLPAIPMDGGRVLRAQIARYHARSKGAGAKSWLAATEQAVRVSRFCAAFMAVLGLTWHPLFLLLAAFVAWASWRELAAVRAKHDPRRGGLFELFDHVLRPRPRAPSASSANGNGHAHAAPPPPPPHRASPSTEGTTSAPLRTPRPATFDLEPLGKSGISDADVERLERWHGRLPRASSRPVE